MNIFFVLLSICLSLVGAYTDIRSGRVKNKHLVIALSIWALFMFLGIVSGKITLYADVVIRYVVNFFFALAFSLFFYVKDIWAPGDAKLFLALSILYPMPMYVVQIGNVFPSLDFIVLAFASGYTAILFASFFKKEKQKRTDWKSILPKPMKKNNILRVIGRLGFASGLSGIFQQLMPNLYHANPVLFSIMTILMMHVNEKQNKSIREAAYAAGILCFAVLLSVQHMWPSAVSMVFHSLIIVLLFDFLNQSIQKNSYQEISANEVKPGMILSYASVWKMQKCIDPDLPRATTENRRSRLNEQQSEAVKRWCRNAKQKVTIVRMMPFAPFIALAVGIEILRFLLFTY